MGFWDNAFGSNGSPAQVVTTTPFDQMQQGGQGGNFNSMANLNSTYLADMFSQLGTGNAPSYYQSYQNKALPYQQKQNAMKYFGTAGNRATDMYGNPTGMGMAAENAAKFGWNPKAQAAQMDKVGQQYMNSSQAIDQYFAGQGLNVIQDTAKGLPGWATEQQNALTSAFHPDTNVIPAVPSSPGWAPGLISSAAQGGIFNGLSSMFSGGGGMGMFNNTARFSMPSASQMAGPMSLAAM